MSDDSALKTDTAELEPEQSRKVFIGSLSYNIDEDSFREYWTQFGNVLYVGRSHCRRCGRCGLV